MGCYHEVVLRRNRDGEFVARVDPEDFGYSLKFGAGGDFDAKAMPAVLAAAADQFGEVLEAIWVDDYSGDGWDCDPPGFSRYVPWDGPAFLYDEPDLPYLVPTEGDEHSRSQGSREVQCIRLGKDWAVGPSLRHGQTGPLRSERPE